MYLVHIMKFKETFRCFAQLIGILQCPENLHTSWKMWQAHVDQGKFLCFMHTQLSGQRTFKLYQSIELIGEMILSDTGRTSHQIQGNWMI